MNNTTLLRQVIAVLTTLIFVGCSASTPTPVLKAPSATSTTPPSTDTPPSQTAVPTQSSTPIPSPTNTSPSQTVVPTQSSTPTPAPYYQWLSHQQDQTSGLLSSQQDNFASTYNNALAVIVFTKKGDYAKAKKILDFFNNRAYEFFDNRCNDFDSRCSQIDPCGKDAPCGFFQYRDSRTGDYGQDVNRWMGDMAWLLMAIHHYQAGNGDTSYDAMAQAIVRLLKVFQQPQPYDCIASGWENGDARFENDCHTEGNLDAYKALSLYGETDVAQQVKKWLDFTDLAWRRGPLDLHSWRVLSLGKEYGFSLPDMEREDDEEIRYISHIDYGNSKVTGFLPVPASEPVSHCPMIWSEGTGQMAVAFYKAGYKERGDFYVDELEKLLFEPAGFPGTQAVSFLALSAAAAPEDCPDYEWVDPSKGHVAAVTWYIFAKEQFDPLDGLVIDSFQIRNPVVKIEAENYDIARNVRSDFEGEISEGIGIHIGGDDAIPNDGTGWAEYRFNTLIPITNPTISIRYADDVDGDTGEILLDGNSIVSFDTGKTPSWTDYITASFAVTPTVDPGLHTLKVEVTDEGTYGFTIDYFRLDGR